MQTIKPESQSEGLESQSEATELEKTRSDGPESQTVGLELDVEVHEEISKANSISKELVLARYVRRHHAPD